MDDAINAESEDMPPQARAIDDVHALSKAARIVRAALARQVSCLSSNHNSDEKDSEAT